MKSEPTSGKTSGKHRPWNGRGLQATTPDTSKTRCLATGYCREQAWLLAQEIMERILWWKRFWHFSHSVIVCNVHVILSNDGNLLGNYFHLQHLNRTSCTSSFYRTYSDEYESQAKNRNTSAIPHLPTLRGALYKSITLGSILAMVCIRIHYATQSPIEMNQKLVQCISKGLSKILSNNCTETIARNNARAAGASCVHPVSHELWHSP